jgi:hypothetical protein
MLNSAYDVLRQFQRNISQTTTISELNQALKQQNLFAKVLFTSPSGEVLTLELPTMMFDGLDIFNIEVVINSSLRTLCSVELLALPVEYNLVNWERSLIGSFKSGLMETLQMR